MREELDAKRTVEVVSSWTPPARKLRTFSPAELRETVDAMRHAQRAYEERERTRTAPNARGVLADDRYGTPCEGTLTFERAQQAHRDVADEMCQAAEIMEANGMAAPGGGTLILFGTLFDAYVHVSDKVVGMLVRLRKHNLAYFVGESLFQTQDDDVPILLLYSAAKVRSLLAERGLHSGVVAGGATL